MKFDVICIGSALLDIYLKSDAFKTIPMGELSGGIALCEEYGGKLEANDMEVTTGGGGTNTAVSFARKGLKTSLVAEMGNDLIAETIKMHLKAEKVDTSLLVHERDEETGVAAILVDKTGGRSAVIFRGASGMLGVNDLRFSRMETNWMYISSLGGQLPVLKALLHFAKESGIKVAVNPGQKEIIAMKREGISVEEFFGGVEVLIVNREEAEGISGIPFKDPLVWQSSRGIGGARYCVITDGREGGKIIFDNQVVFYEPKMVEVIEETGAGDAFGSALVTALIFNRDVKTAIEWGKAQAASVVSYIGPKKGLLYRKDLEG